MLDAAITEWSIQAAFLRVSLIECNTIYFTSDFYHSGGREHNAVYFRVDLSVIGGEVPLAGHHNFISGGHKKMGDSILESDTGSCRHGVF